jgi:phosphoglycerol geranylgeranyltransferase
VKFDTFIKKLNSPKPALAVLVDPDKFNPQLVSLAVKNGADCFLVGGSRLRENNVSVIVKTIQKMANLPVILFPGDETQLTKEADGLLLISLLSGRNPEYLIEKQVKAAPIIKRMKLSYLPTAYLLIQGGKASATQKVTNTVPIDPSDITRIKNTSIAGEQLGFKAIYLEAGSGAKSNVPAALVKKIKQSVSIPLIVGGGIDSAKKARALIKAGADMIVIGNALETDMRLINEISTAFK